MPLARLPDIDPIVPTFSAALEGEIDRVLTARLGRAPTTEERSDYRQVLWTFASALRDILESSPSPPPCPAPPSTSASRASPMTSSA
jgi:hypothetical protein